MRNRKGKSARLVLDNRSLWWYNKVYYAHRKTNDMKILAIGDVVGARALEYLKQTLWKKRAQLGADVVVVNGENAADIHGITRAAQRRRGYHHARKSHVRKKGHRIASERLGQHYPPRKLSAVPARKRSHSAQHQRLQSALHKRAGHGSYGVDGVSVCDRGQDT